jgi:hypothetical protein
MEQEKKIVGREYLSTTRCDLEEGGNWKAVNTIHDRVLYEGQTEWIDELVEAMSYDANCQQAIQTAMSSTLNYLIQNVYQNGFNGLVEYRAYQKQLEQRKELKVEDVSSEAKSI